MTACRLQTRIGALLGALALLPAASPASAGPNTTTSSTGAQSTSLSLNAGNSRVVSVNRWPTIYTNTPIIGINAGWSFPYYINPFRVGPDGIPTWWFGYPPYWPRSNPGTPFLWTNTPWFWPRTYDGPPLVEIARRVDPAILNLPVVPAPPPPPPPTPAELARAALLAHEYNRAAIIYARLADEQREQESAAPQPPAPDRIFEMLNALALAGARQFPAAADVIERMDSQPPPPTNIPAPEMLSSATELRRIVNGAVAWAHEENTPRAWRLVAFLMEIEGRVGPAERMRERAALLEIPRVPAPAPGRQIAPHGPASFSMPTPDPAPQEPASQPEP